MALSLKRTFAVFAGARIKAARKNPEDSRGGPNYNVDVRLLQQSQANTGRYPMALRRRRGVSRSTNASITPLPLPRFRLVKLPTPVCTG